MDIDFKYDFSQLSASRLHSVGIRSTKEIVEVFEDLDSQFDIISNDRYPIMAAIGFTSETKPVKIAFSLIGDNIFFLDARIPSKKELIEEFCRFNK